MTRKYLPGICYTCQKCLICFSSKTCDCEKVVKLTRVKKPKRGQQIYSRLFTPNEKLEATNQFLYSANKKYQYNNNFNESFSFTLCTACNSKLQRLKSNDKLAKTKNKFKKKGSIKEEKLTKMSDNFVDIDGDDDDVSDFSEVEEYSIDEIKLQIVIEKKEKKTSTSKTIIIKPVEYVNVIEKINDAVQKALKNKKIIPADYSLSYKAVNARGPSSTLEDKLDFNEFIEDYKKVIAANKKMSIIVLIGDDSIKEKTKSKRSKVKSFYNI
jgi:hypothetical protein